jgi:hypothetical protein
MMRISLFFYVLTYFITWSIHRWFFDVNIFNLKLSPRAKVSTTRNDTSSGVLTGSHYHRQKPSERDPKYTSSSQLPKARNSSQGTCYYLALVQHESAACLFLIALFLQLCAAEVTAMKSPAVVTQFPDTSEGSMCRRMLKQSKISSVSVKDFIDVSDT